MYADVILPLPLRMLFTYQVPEHLTTAVCVGGRVAVEVGKRKIYAGLIAELHNRPPERGTLKPLLHVIDRTPVVTEQQLKLWRWISEYYMCSLGEVMKNLFLSAMKMDTLRNADDTFQLSPRFKPETERYITLSERFTSATNATNASNPSVSLATNLSRPAATATIDATDLPSTTATIDATDLPDTTNTPQRPITRSTDTRNCPASNPSNIATADSSFHTATTDELLNTTLDSLKRAKQQYNALCYLLDKAQPLSVGATSPRAVARKQMEQAGFSSAVLRELERKEIFKSIDVETLTQTPSSIPGASKNATALGQSEAAETQKTVCFSNTHNTSHRSTTTDSRNTSTPLSRSLHAHFPQEKLPQLSDLQESAYKTITTHFASKQVSLLHGISGSGKTEIYIHLIKDALEAGRQVLYLLPEIAITTQLIDRLTAVFDPFVAVFHSKNSEKSRFSIYNSLLSGGGDARLIIGTRSSVSLPFSNLGLVIVDEEHDSSYKQNDPAPRYHGRDVAVVLSKFHDCNTLLGSATPSIESYHNAITGKYGLAELRSTYSGVRLSKTSVIDRRGIKKEAAHTHESRYLSLLLIRRIEATLQQKKQVILLQNRRGFSLYVECGACGYVPHCVNCNVSLTYHKGKNRLVCHYCGYSTSVDSTCPQCKAIDLKMKGIGTEKVEEEVQFLFPEARVERFDFDSIKSVGDFQKIIARIEQGKIDIIIGTQMISKGFDFANVALVGVINADNMLNFPDFRADERAFQLISQVSGRAGRRESVGETIIQTAQPQHPVIVQLRTHDYRAMFDQQITERRAAHYPPFSRMITLTVKHQDPQLVRDAAQWLTENLRARFGAAVSDNYTPLIDRIKGNFIATLTLRFPSNSPLAHAKADLWAILSVFKAHPRFRVVVLQPNVDPS